MTVGLQWRLLERAVSGRLPLTKRRRLAMILAGAAVWLASCQRETARESAEYVYVGGAEVELRDQLGPESRVIGVLQSGERLRVLARRPRWIQVSGPDGQIGWVLQRSLVSQEVYDRFEALAQQAAGMPSQGSAVLRRAANLHDEPGRSTQIFYQLPEGQLVEVVGHAVAPHNPVGADGANVPAQHEDWLLVRAPRGRAGWLLEGAADMNPPIEVAQYREGLRIRAWFVIHREMDRGEERPWYLWATIRRLAGQPYEFDEIRVFVWNPRASRYETSYRERNLIGFYPITVGRRETSSGPSPTFRLQLEDAAGQRYEKSYYMIGRQVRVER